jgi:hypothetical protein
MTPVRVRTIIHDGDPHLMVERNGVIRLDVDQHGKCCGG